MCGEDREAVGSLGRRIGRRKGCVGGEGEKKGGVLGLR